MNEEETFEETLHQQFRQTNKIHWNLEQVVIVTTEDKLRLCLHKAIDHLGTKREWRTAVALSVTLVLALTTAEFKDKLAIPAATWHAIFLISTGASLIWAFVAIWKASKVKVSVESIVSEIKQKSPEIADVEAGQRD
jgi:hypothetical protein